MPSPSTLPNFFRALFNSLLPLKPGMSWAASAIRLRPNASEDVRSRRRSNILFRPTIILSPSIKTSVSSNGVYGGTPHIAAISMSSMRSASEIENCRAISAIDTSVRCINQGNIVRSPCTRASELRGPRLPLMLHLLTKPQDLQ